MIGHVLRPSLPVLEFIRDPSFPHVPAGKGWKQAAATTRDLASNSYVSPHDLDNMRADVRVRRAIGDEDPGVSPVRKSELHFINLKERN